MFDDQFVGAIRAAFPAFKGELSEGTTASEIPGWDSFGHVQLIFELEDAYGIRIDVASSLNCEDLGSLYNLVEDTIGE